MEDSNNIHKTCCSCKDESQYQFRYTCITVDISSYFPDDVIFRFLWDPFHMTENTVYRIYMVHYLLEFFYYYREALAFATEPVFASLANVLGDHTNVPTPVPSELTEYKLFDVEIKHGIIQVNAHNKNLISVQKIYWSTFK